MNAASLKQKTELHNKIRIGLCVGFSLLSVVLFLVSFIVVRVISYFILYAIFESAWSVSFWCAAVFVLVLLFEGLRNARHIFETAPAYSPDDDVAMGIDNLTSVLFQGRNRGWLHAANLFATIFFIAPYSALRAIEEYHNRINPTDFAVQQASAVFKLLKQTPQWQPVERFQPYAQGIVVLQKLELVWVDRDRGELEIKIAE